MQVLDVFGFAIFKHRLRSVYHEERCKSSTGHLDVVEVIKLVVCCISKVLNGYKWVDAFAQVGFARSLDRLSTYILRKLDVTTPPVVLSSKPTIGDIQICYPINRRPFYVEHFRWIELADIWNGVSAPAIVETSDLPSSSGSHAITASINLHHRDNAASSGITMPSVLPIGSTGRRRNLPASFGTSVVVSSSSTDPVEALDQHLLDQAHIYTWLNNGVAESHS